MKDADRKGVAKQKHTWDRLHNIERIAAVAQQTDDDQKRNSRHAAENKKEHRIDGTSTSGCKVQTQRKERTQKKARNVYLRRWPWMEGKPVNMLLRTENTQERINSWTGENKTTVSMESRRMAAYKIKDARNIALRR